MKFENTKQEKFAEKENNFGRVSDQLIKWTMKLVGDINYRMKYSLTGEIKYDVNKLRKDVVDAIKGIESCYSFLNENKVLILKHFCDVVRIIPDKPEQSYIDNLDEAYNSVDTGVLKEISRIRDILLDRVINFKMASCHEMELALAGKREYNPEDFHQKAEMYIVGIESCYGSLIESQVNILKQFCKVALAVPKKPAQSYIDKLEKAYNLVDSEILQKL